MVLVGLVRSDFKSRGACTETFPKEIYHLSYAKHISHPEDISFALGQSPSQSPALTALPKGEPRDWGSCEGIVVFQSLPLWVSLVCSIFVGAASGRPRGLRVGTNSNPLRIRAVYDCL